MKPNVVAALCQATFLMLAVGFSAAAADAQERPDPMVAPEGITQLSEHVYLIPDNNVGLVPNVGIVVGSRATLVIDTGLGDENGEIVFRAASEVSGAGKFYVASTHFHPEHDLGAGVFPATATVVRSADQQADVEEFGLDLAERFAGFSDRNAELLEGVTIRPADVVYTESLSVDLGGVTVRFLEIGPTHTRGDMAFLVEEDGVLFSGDVVMAAYPAFNSPYSSLDRWLDALDELEALGPDLIVPSHGRTGTVEMIGDYREYMTTLRERVRALAGEGTGADEIAEALAGDMETEFSQWRPSAGRVRSAVRAAFRER